MHSYHKYYIYAYFTLKTGHFIDVYYFPCHRSLKSTHQDCGKVGLTQGSSDVLACTLGGFGVAMQPSLSGHTQGYVNSCFSVCCCHGYHLTGFCFAIFFFEKRFIDFYFVFDYVMNMHCMCAWCPWRPEKGVITPGTGLTHTCKLRAGTGN